MTTIATQHFAPQPGTFSRLYSDITEIPDDIPDNTTRVTLFRNKITRIRANAFMNLSLCVELYLPFNLISEIEDGAFNGLESLQHLDLHGNLIYKLRANMFGNLLKSTRLSLLENPITEIEPDAFKGLSSLNRLDVSVYELGILKANSFIHLSRCTRLDLTGKLTQEKWQHDLVIEAGAFNGLHSLKFLILDSVKMTRIESDVFSGIDNCTHIRGYNSKIHSIATGAFHGLNLRKLELGSSFIQQLESGVFKYLENLRELLLNDNSLDKIHEDTFSGLHKLELLSLNNNTIHLVPDLSFIDLINLQKLDLGDNEITLIKFNTFNGLLRLEKLYLQHNNINSIQDNSFAYLPNLLVLSLADNNLTQLPYETFIGLESLTSLSLANNKIVAIGESVFIELPRPLQLDLEGNIVECNNGMKWLKEELEAGTVTGLSIPTCTVNCDWETLICNEKEEVDEDKEIVSGEFSGIRRKKL